MIRFYFDEHVSAAIDDAAIERGLDVATARERGMLGRADVEHFALATAEQRCIVTRDYGDFWRLTETALAAATPHFGIVFLSPRLERTPGVAVDRPVSIAESYPDGLQPYTILWL